MKGINKLSLNGATMNEALTYWLQNEFLTSDAEVEVTHISWNANSMMFDITIKGE